MLDSLHIILAEYDRDFDCEGSDSTSTFAKIIIFIIIELIIFYYDHHTIIYHSPFVTRIYKIFCEVLGFKFDTSKSIELFFGYKTN